MDLVDSAVIKPLSSYFPRHYSVKCFNGLRSGTLALTKELKSPAQWFKRSIRAFRWRQSGRVMGPEAEILELKRQVERLSLFHEVGKALFSTLDLQKILQTIMEKISDLLQPDTWSLLMLDEDTHELYFEIAIGSGAEKLRDVRLKLGEGVAGWVAQHGEPLLVENARSDPRFTSKLEEVSQAETRSIVCVPIKAHDHVLGVIELVNALAKPSFGAEDIPILKSLADYAAIALENARYVQRIHELTITDDCTAIHKARHLNFVLDTEIYRDRKSTRL